MLLLIRFPESILCDILGNWIVLRELNLMDTTICNKNLRSLLLGTFLNPHFVLHSINSETDRFQWIIHRKLKFRKLVFTISREGSSETSESNVFVSNQLDRSDLVSFSVLNMSSVSLMLRTVFIINNSPLLTEVKFDNISQLTEDVAHQLYVNCFEKITKIRYIDKYNHSEAVFNILTRDCMYLTHCEVDILDLSEEMLVNLVTVNKNLEHLAIGRFSTERNKEDNTEDLLTVIASNCPLLQVFII